MNDNILVLLNNADLEARINRLSNELNRENLTAEERNEIQDSLANSTDALNYRLGIQKYRRIMRPAHLRFLQQISEAHNADPRNLKTRRLFLGALFNVCSTALLDSPEFSYLKPYFPKLKLPLKIRQSDFDELENAMLEDLQLKKLVELYLDLFKPEEWSKPEAQLHIGIWAPLLSTLVAYVSQTLNQDIKLYSVNELNAKIIDSFPWLKYVDFAAMPPGESRRPILLVEIAEGEVPFDGIHKDFKKLEIIMAHVLMDLIKRAKTECPDEDYSKFRVYGLLIGGRTFELCVGTVAKGPDGKINFNFHTHNRHWKFALFGPQLGFEDSPGSADYICEGTRSEFGNFDEIADATANDDIIRNINVFAGQEIVNPIEDPDDDETLNEQSEFQGNPGNHDQNFHKSVIILIKFFQDMVNYFTELPACLQSCLIDKPEEFSEESEAFKFPSVLPPLLRSSAKHSQTSPQVECSTALAVLDDPNEPAINDFYVKIYKGKRPNLPDVSFYDANSKSGFIRKCGYALKKMTEHFSNFKSPQRLELNACKFIIDILVALYWVHKDGLVCGIIEPVDIYFDMTFWRISSLPRLAKVTDIPLPDLTTLSCEERCFMTPQINSYTYDLVSLAWSLDSLLTRNLRYIVVYREKGSSFDLFLQCSYDKMSSFVMNPEVDLVNILRDCVPIFKDLVKGANMKTELNPFSASILLANEAIDDADKSFPPSFNSSVESMPISTNVSK